MLDLLMALPGAVAQGLVWGVMAVGVFLTYKILDIADLTVDGSICTGGAVCAVLVLHGCNVYLAILAGCAAGALCGIVTGVLHVFLGIPAILAGILTQMSLWSINLKILGQANQALPSRKYPVLLTQMNIPQAILILVIISALLIALLYLFFGTEIGCAIRATGSNAKMSRAQGINTNTTRIMGLAISNAIVAFCGALLTQFQGYADINMGRGAVVIGLAAVVIGSAVVKRISSNFAVRLVGVVIGAILYYVVFQIIVAIGLDTDLLKMLSAVVVAAFLGVPYVKKKYFAAKPREKGGNDRA